MVQRRAVPRIEGLLKVRPLHVHGTAGRVYSAQMGASAVIVKVVPRSPEADREARISKRLGRARIGPRVYRVVWRSGDVTMVMQRMTGTLRVWIDNDPSRAERIDALARIESLFTRIHGLGFAHADVHEDNIMYLKRGGRVRWCLVDFGWTHSLGQGRFPKLPWVDYTCIGLGGVDDSLVNAYLGDTMHRAAERK